MKEEVINRKIWYEISIQVPVEFSEILGEITEKEGINGLWIEEKEEDKKGAYLCAKGYVEANRWAPEIIDRLKNSLKSLLSSFVLRRKDIRVSYRKIEGENWVTSFKSYFKPFKVGDVWIRPPWEKVLLVPMEKELIIDPGRAFGTGQHESTKLCLLLCKRLFPSLNPEIDILDLGTGTGILAIYAAKSGFENIYAIDIDPVSIEETKKNAKFNRVTDRIKAALIPLREIDLKFDLILANLTRPIIESMAEEIVLHLKDQGFLLLSGFLQRDVEPLAVLFNEKNLRIVEEEYMEGWASILMKKEVVL